MSIEKFRLENEQALIENEITEYRKLIQKLKKNPDTELSESIPTKPECLSNLVYLHSNSSNNNAKDNLDSKIRNLADRIIRTYR